MCLPLAKILRAPAGDPSPAGPPPQRATPAFAELLRRAPPRRIVDLTHPFSADFPTFDGKPHVIITPIDRYAEVGYAGNQLTHHEHVGTHVDAPAHFAADGLTVDEIPVNDLVLPAVVIDARARAAADPDMRLDVADIRAFEAAHGTIPRAPPCSSGAAGMHAHTTPRCTATWMQPA
ncbi:Metal-dependent hydrolase [Minicystis rosea]|nr:Metal-dependent hydrolase [Minicystis rosea]